MMTKDLFLRLEWLNMPATEFIDKILEQTSKTKSTQSYGTLMIRELASDVWYHGLTSQ